ncbi:mCG148325 [Mus musculus]|nr:mCG148325 [Mus musculus]
MYFIVFIVHFLIYICLYMYIFPPYFYPLTSCIISQLFKSVTLFLKTVCVCVAQFLPPSCL